jgi:methyl-accepting chemotaxis protein
MVALAVLGSIGGVVALITAITLIARGIFKQVSSTEDNTQAVKDLTKAVGELKDLIAQLQTRVAVLEDRNKRNVHGSTP